MRFHSAMATLEPQKYVTAGTVGTENILLFSGRLVIETNQGDHRRRQKDRPHPLAEGVRSN